MAPAVPTRATYLTSLTCAECGQSHAPDEPHTVCVACGETLLPTYDEAAIGAAVTKDEMQARPPGLWRYREFLPLAHTAAINDLGEGGTPLLHLNTLGQALGMSELWLKDEGANPTGTFKARGAAVGVARAKELGLRELAIPTAGNAGSAWSAYAAAAGLRIHVVMPVETPAPIKAECQAYGAEVTEVRGVISDAGRIVAQRAAEHGWFDASTMREPYRVDGKKTMGFEIAEAFEWSVPDVILYPTGGGVGLIGIWKAMLELQAAGWIGDRLPRLVAVQAEHCRPVVDAFVAGAPAATRAADPQTQAAGLRVPLPFAHKLVLRILRDTGGTAVAVSDAELLVAMRELARTEGLFVCPEGAALLPALRGLLERGDIRPDERVVLLNTGNGLKYTHLIDRSGATVVDPLPA